MESSIPWDAVSGVAAVITLFYLVYQFHYLPRKARRESIFQIKVLFGVSKSKLENLMRDLISYQIDHNCEYQDFLPNVTFHSQIHQFAYLLVTDLNDDALEKIIKQATSDPLIFIVVDSLNKQIFSFTQIEAHFNTAFKFK